MNCWLLSITNVNIKLEGKQNIFLRYVCCCSCIFPNGCYLCIILFPWYLLLLFSLSLCVINVFILDKLYLNIWCCTGDLAPNINLYICREHWMEVICGVSATISIVLYIIYSTMYAPLITHNCTCLSDSLCCPYFAAKGCVPTAILHYL